MNVAEQRMYRVTVETRTYVVVRAAVTRLERAVYAGDVDVCREAATLAAGGSAEGAERRVA